jgi:hypothetical protein
MLILLRHPPPTAFGPATSLLFDAALTTHSISRGENELIQHLPGGVCNELKVEMRSVGMDDGETENVD